MYKVESPQQVYSIETYQDRRFTFLEIPSRGKQFSLQDISKRCLFPSAAVHELICLVRKSLRVSWPLS